MDSNSIYIKNSHGLRITKKAFDEWCTGIVDKTFKVMPIFEGKISKDSSTYIDKDIAYDNYKKYLQILIFEVCGGYYSFPDEVKFLEIINILKGMNDIEKDQHRVMKRMTFKVIDLINDLKEE